MNSDRIMTFFMLALSLICLFIMLSFVCMMATPIHSDSTIQDEPSSIRLWGDDSYDIPIEGSDIASYNNMNRYLAFNWVSYRFATVNDPLMVKIYENIEPRLSGMNDYEKADYIRLLVQCSTGYASDYYLHDSPEYIQYPSETIISGSGDCEDLSLLLYTLYRMAGLDAVLVTQLDHVYVGVAVDGTGEYVSTLFSDKRYYTVETTSVSDIGDFSHTGFSLAYHPSSLMISEIVLLFSLLAVVTAYSFNQSGKSRGYSPIMAEAMTE